MLCVRGACRVAVVLGPLRRERPAASPLLSMALVELVCSVVCEPGSATTDGKLLHAMLTECASLGRCVFSLFHHPARECAATLPLLPPPGSAAATL